MTDTPMHASKLGAQTWLLAIFQIVSNPKGRSSVQSAADLGICQKSARRLAHRIRTALAEGSLAGLEGAVEADGAYIGGKAPNMHARKRSLCASGPADKAPVIAVRDRASGLTALHCRTIGHSSRLRPDTTAATQHARRPRRSPAVPARRGTPRRSRHPQAATRALVATTQDAPPRSHKPPNGCPATSTPNSDPRTPPG